MSAPASTHRFCPSCGAPHDPEARFCGNCGEAFSPPATPPVSSVPPARTRRQAPEPSKGAPSPPAPKNWKVTVGDRLPNAATLFPEVGRKRRAKAEPKKASSHARPGAAPKVKAKSIFGSTLAMAVTQGADLVTRTMESGGGTGDPQLQLRLAIAAGIAVFGLFLGPLPRLRMILVRLGTVVLALLQGGSLVSVLGGLATDPQLISTVAPNLGAQAASMLAIFRLFKVAGRN